MFEKVNPSHPDKIADRVAGALVDYAYTQEDSPRIAVEVLVGHGMCNIIAETSISIPQEIIDDIVLRTVGPVTVNYTEVPQDINLSNNQLKEIRCGDNGIFRGVPVTLEQKMLSDIARRIYERFGTDGKYIIDDRKLIICQSYATDEEILKTIDNYKEYFDEIVINPLGYWTGGIEVDSGATNRKLGSDMADSVTGGGLSGKDCSKADVSANIYAWLLAQKYNKEVEFSCAIGDTEIDGISYSDITKTARDYIMSIGGFEKFAEWGLV